MTPKEQIKCPQCRRIMINNSEECAAQYCSCPACDIEFLVEGGTLFQVFHGEEKRLNENS